MKSLWLVLFCSGCFNFTKIPDQDQATDIVWGKRYNMHDQGPPAVEWIHQKDLTCAAEASGRLTGFYRGSWFGDKGHTSICVLGVTWVDVEVAEVALADDETFSTSAFAHELFHQYLTDTTGSPDSDHKNPGFGINYGFTKGIVDFANDDLAGAGL